VVSEGRARRRPLTRGVQDDGYYQVLDGLSAGEQIVTTGQSSLRDDARVEIVGQPPAPAAAEATSPAAG
jgi:membrane fusion protein, multidrug efflux system